jgi:hypothetical protein
MNSNENNCNNNSNSYCNNNEDLLETSCNNVISYNDSMDSTCNCGFDNDEYDNIFPENPMFAQSYVPVQTLNTTYKPYVGLKMGTIFPELVSPYEPLQSISEIEYLREANTIGKGCNKCN